MIKTLDLDYLDEISKLINNNYFIDNNIFQTIVHKHFLYWCFKTTHPNLIFGLVYNKKLIGILMTSVFEYNINGKIESLPQLTILCLEKRIDNIFYKKMLIDELYRRVKEIKLKNIFFIFQNDMSYNMKYHVLTKYIIPINYDKFKKLGLMDITHEENDKLDNNPLHLMKLGDLDSVICNLNISLQDKSIKPIFNKNNGYNFLIPKKNIVLSFVLRNNSNQDITDFICVNLSFLKYIESGDTINVANLAFYYNKTLTLTDLVIYLLDKLRKNNIDQLVFTNNNNNMDINITKYSSKNKIYFNLSDIEQTSILNLSYYPI